MHKITRIIALILGVLGLALCGWLMISSDKVKNSLSNFPMNGMFILGYLLLAIGLVVVIFSAIYYLHQNLSKRHCFIQEFSWVL